MTTDGILLAPYCPYMVTAMCSAGKTGLQTLKKELPDTEVIGVTALTSLLNEDTIKMFRCNATNASKRFAKEAVDARIDGVVCAATEAETIRDIIGKDMTINTPAIRPVWAIVAGDDQNPERIMTPARAIKARADRLVVGRPITQAESPRDAVMRTLEEIDKAL